MKKRGSALVVVLLTLTALVIIGLATYSYIVNTSKLNNDENNNEALKGATMSALSIGEYYLINKQKYKNIKVGQGAYFTGNDIKDILSDDNFKNISYVNKNVRLSNDNYKYYVKVYNEGNNEFNINATVTLGNLKSSKNSIVKIEDEELKGKDFFNVLDNKKIGMFNILGGHKFSVEDLSGSIENVSYNFYGLDNNVKLPSLLKNGINLNKKNEKTKSLNLILKKGDISVSNLNELINKLENHNIFGRKMKVVLINEGYEKDEKYKIKYFKSIEEAKSEFKDYSAILIKLNRDFLNADWHDSYLLVCNGNLDIENIGESNYGLEGDELFIYSSGKVEFNEVKIGTHNHLFMNDDVYMSIVSKNGINIEDSDIYLKGSFKDISNNLKNVLKKLIK
ncbi:hypothetical protein [Clostridium sp.]|uniref:hypothetical protein n=1 Tax=Clostridium sp. TaxID=1506 RepID=UPI0026DC2710|nr:hypothetical protein [Clostridium sp.]MDO5038639.1 hypothetical protein [Clostridium sp.]